MPNAPRRGCKRDGCPKLTSKGVYCTEHAKEAVTARLDALNKGKTPEERKLYDSTAWKKLRDIHKRKFPWCRKCGKTKFLQVDHVKPHKGNVDLFYDEENLQTLCKQCHAAKGFKRD